MNITINHTLDMLKRVSRLDQDFPITPALPRATAAIAEVNTTITALEAAAQNQTGGASQQAGGVDLRKVYSRDLKAFLKEVNRTARTLEPEHPGIRPTFRLPKSGSYPALVASAQSIIEAATPLSAAFEAAGMPATFLTDLQAMLTAFTNATGQKHNGGITRVVSTAALKAKASLGIIAADKFGACFRNHYRLQPEMIAAWNFARRIARRSTPPAPEPPSPPAEGSGSTTIVGG
jgi:hypothetical protein